MIEGNHEPSIESYDFVIVAFSGGKDSAACLLHLIEVGVDVGRLELWHHDVDGRQGSKLRMDWPCTPAYCRAVASELGIPIYFTWKHGGFEGEMLRENALTQPISFECPTSDGVEVRTTGGIRGKVSTRRAFPQVAADLSVRWCSAYLKIDNARTALRNQERFHGKRTLFVSGERAEESPGRANYNEFEPDDADLRNGRVSRHIDRWRPVHKWTESQVWEIMQRHGMEPHPAYNCGWSRCSCMNCIFNGADEFATSRKIDPDQFDLIANYEVEFGRTVKRNVSLPVLADSGTAFDVDEVAKKKAMSSTWTTKVFDVGREWKLPVGAFRGGAGPS